MPPADRADGYSPLVVVGECTAGRKTIVNASVDLLREVDAQQETRTKGEASPRGLRLARPAADGRARP